MAEALKSEGIDRSTSEVEGMDDDGERRRRSSGGR